MREATQRAGMTAMATNVLTEQIRRIASAGGHRVHTDRQLLEAFACRREEAAFTALVRRHGPMVLAVGRRVLGHQQDAEDVFQATFLVLARKAAAVRNGQALTAWLHRAAYRLALGL